MQKENLTQLQWNSDGSTLAVRVFTKITSKTKKTGVINSDITPVLDLWKSTNWGQIGGNLKGGLEKNEQSTKKNRRIFLKYGDSYGENFDYPTTD